MCGAQVLVYHDLLGMMQHPHHAKVTPKFCKQYAAVGHVRPLDPFLCLLQLPTPFHVSFYHLPLPTILSIIYPFLQLLLLSQTRYRVTELLDGRHRVCVLYKLPELHDGQCVCHFA